MKFAWTALITMSVIGYVGLCAQERAENAEFTLATAQLVAPQVRAHAQDYVLIGDTTRAKGEWAWFAKAHVGLGEAMNRPVWVPQW